MVHLTGYNFAIALFVAAGGYTYAYAYAVFATVIGEPGFYAYFNLDPTSDYAASIIGAMSALFAAGAGIGALVQGWTGDLLGRRLALALASLISLVGCACVAGAVNVAMFIVFRFVQGFGLGQCFAMVPLYTTEVAPPHRRGLLAGLTGASIVTGYVTSAWVGFGAYFAKDLTVQWRLPLGISCLAPLLLLIGTYWIPESPRYLTLVGRKEEALAILLRIHHDPNDPNDTAAHAEAIQISRQVEFDKEQKSGYLEMFKSPSWRKRSLIAFGLMFATQSTGCLGITTFQVVIYQALGLENSMPLLMYGVYVTVAAFFNYAGAYSVDLVGRRRMFLIGYPLIAVILLVEALLQKYFVGTTNKGGNAACVVFIFLYISAYSFFLDPAQFVYVSEIFPTTIRAKGVGIAFFAYFVGAITYTAPAAVAFKNIGWKMYMVWFSCNIVSTILIYFFIPETTKISLEEIGELFGDKVVLHMANDGHIVELENKSDLGNDGHIMQLEDRTEDRNGNDAKVSNIG
ncbi:hypothetical protein LTR93_000692 [Exophiala xenobiotica]|nr:hypothetical protein LTR93_000692 [Exophiala xenobiotica]